VARTIRDAIAVWRASRKADVIHLHTALAPGSTLLRAGLLALAGRVRGANVVVHAHGGLVEGWLTTSTRRLLARTSLAPARLIIAVSEGGRASLARALPAHRVRCIPNGVDAERFSPGDPTEPAD